MVAETQNIQEQLNTINTNTENRLQQITKEIGELVDEPEDNDKLELSGKLTSNVADILKEHPDVAKNLLDIMNSISQDNTDLNNDPSRIELQNFIKPYIQSFDFASSNITDTKGHFVKGIDNENHNKVSEAITLIDSLKNELTDNNIIIDPELGLTLQNISSILAKPNNDNTKILQDFLLGKLEGKDQEEFKIHNYIKGKPDGQFGPYTMKGLMTFLKSAKTYIKDLKYSRDIQNQHDEERAVIDEQERINNLTFGKAMAEAPFKNDGTIQEIMRQIATMESNWKDVLEDEEKNRLQSDLEKKREERKTLNDWLNNLNKYKKEDKAALKADNGLSDEDRRRLENTYSDRNIANEKKRLESLEKDITSLEDQLACNKNVKILNKISQLEGHYKKLIFGWNDQINQLNANKKSNDPNISQQLRAQLQQKEQEDDKKIQELQGNINKVLFFFGWKQNTEGRVVIDAEANPNSDYKDYKSKLEQSETIEISDQIDLISINDDFRLRGEWKNLNPEQILAQKKNIEERLNSYIGIRQYLPDEMKTVLALAQKALNDKTNLEDKNDGVWTLERKLDELGYMGDGVDANNGVDGKFGNQTYNALLNYIDAQLKEHTEIKKDDIRVTLRGERDGKDGDELNNIKNDITNQLNSLRNSKRDSRSYNQKIVLRLAKTALESESHLDEHLRPVSDEVLALENKLAELGVMPKEATPGRHNGIDGKFGTETYNTLIAYLKKEERDN